MRVSFFGSFRPSALLKETLTMMKTLVIIQRKCAPFVSWSATMLLSCDALRLKASALCRRVDWLCADRSTSKYRDSRLFQNRSKRLDIAVTLHWCYLPMTSAHQSTSRFNRCIYQWLVKGEKITFDVFIAHTKQIYSCIYLFVSATRKSRTPIWPFFTFLDE